MTTRAELDATLTAAQAAEKFTRRLGGRDKAHAWALTCAAASADDPVLAGWWQDVAGLTAPDRVVGRPAPVRQDVPVALVDHGESAMPGGKLTWPGAAALVAEYAARPEPFPPIEVLADAATGRYMVLDGSHRLEAARRRGDATIPAWVFPDLGDA